MSKKELIEKEEAIPFLIYDSNSKSKNPQKK